MRAASWRPPCTGPNAASGWKPFRARRPRSTRRRATARSRRAAVSPKPAASSNCRRMLRWETGSPDAFWLKPPGLPLRRNGRARKIPSAAETEVGPVFDLGRRNGLLGLMRVERARAGGPALRQNLHRKQFGVDFRLERAGRSDRAGCAVVGFYSFIRAIGHVPDIGLGHGCITREGRESFAINRKRFSPGPWSRPRLEWSHQAIIDRFETSAEKPRRPTGGILMQLSNESLLVILFVGLIAGWLAGQIVRGTGFGIIGDIIVGVLGALVASLLFPKLGISLGTGLVREILYSAIGAIILLLVVRLFRTGGRF